MEADAQNPNLYSSLENLKDNRKMENFYDELNKKATASATVPRRGKHGASGNNSGAEGNYSLISIKRTVLLNVLFVKSLGYLY